MIMERNIMLTLSYDGSGYHGWQLQDNADTVQGQLMKAVERITGTVPKLHGCSRTDSGVHANMFCCNFKTDCTTECRKLMRGLNAVLPDSISVTACNEVHESFHSRFDCKGKEYIYKIWNSEAKNPFLKNLALHYPYKLDADMLNSQAKAFVGTYDFSAFCSSGTDVQDKTRTVYSCGVRREGDLVIFSVRGDGFLYNMVRIMVGTLLDISSGKIERDTVRDIILSKDRNRSGITARAEGLYLNKVFYSENEVTE